MGDPLGDITVVELSQMVAGPFAGMQLADLGADVVKIERPDFGEIARNIEPRVGGESFYYLSVNRGKQSVTLDLKTDAGKAAFEAIASKADVVIENFTPGTVEDLGVGYEDVAAVNPDVIYCSVSAFGQSGPLRDKSGVDPVIQAYAGIASLTRDTDGRPLRVGVTIADIAGALFAVQSILAALRRRDRTGEGEYIDVALSDSLLSLLSVRAGYSFATGDPFPAIGRSHVYFVPEGIFTTADGYIQVSTVTKAQWERLCGVLGREELLTDPRFESLPDRREHRDELNSLLDAEFAKRTTAEWEADLAAQNVPAYRIHDTQTVWDDEQTKARDMQAAVTTPEGATFPTIDYPVKHITWDRERRESIASLGEHTQAVLEAVGFEGDMAVATGRSNPED